jgi:nucleotide-binding universal stress UspA family protein
MKTIIVATNHSDTANNAVRFSADLARVFKAELLLFNSYQLNVHVRNALVGPNVLDQISKDNDNRMRQLVQDLALQYQINVRYKISNEVDTLKELENYAGDQDANLVVMGMDSNLPEYEYFGNTTTAAIRRQKYPILVVPNDIQFKPINKILYACEYKYLGHDNHLDLFKEIAGKFAAKLEIFHVNTSPADVAAVATDGQREAIDRLVDDLDHVYNTVEHPSVIDGIMEGVKKWQADLLVMVPHKTGLWELVLRGSNTREIALRTRIPLLVLPNIN